MVKLIGLLVLCAILCELQIKSIHGEMEFWGVIWGLALFVKNLTLVELKPHFFFPPFESIYL